MEKRINTSLHLVPYSLRILLCIIVSVVWTPPLYTNYITTVAEAFLHLVLPTVVSNAVLSGFDKPIRLNIH